MELPSHKRAIRSLALYGASILLVSAANFLVVPLLIYALGDRTFAVWALLEPLALAAIPVAGLGLHLGLMHQGRSSSDDLSEAIAKLLMPHAAIAGALGIAVALLASTSGSSPINALLLGGIVWSEGLLVFFVSVFRSQDRPLAFAAMEGGRSVAVLTVFAALTIGSPATAQLVLYLSIRLAAAVIALGLGLQLVRPQWKPSLSSALSAIKYGGPIVAAAMMVAFLTNFDRYVLFWIGAGATVTDYTAHSKLAQTLALATAPFFMWFAPLVMRKLPNGTESHAFFINATSIVLVLTALAAGSLWLMAPFVWSWIFPSILYDNLLLGFMTAGAAAFALGNTFSIGSLEGGKTHYSLIVTGISMLVGIGAAVLIGRFMGPEGVAIGRAAGMAAYTALFATMTVRSLKIRYPWAKYGTFVALSFIVAVVLSKLLPSTNIVATFFLVTSFLVACCALAMAVWPRESYVALSRLRSSAEIN